MTATPLQLSTSAQAAEPFLATEFYTQQEVLARLKISRWTLLRRVKDGSIPPPLKLRGIGDRWRGADMQRYVESSQP